MTTVHCTFDFGKSISMQQLMEVRSWCHNRYGRLVDIQPASPSFGVVLEAISAISGVVAAVIATIALCYQVRQHERSNTWTLQRLRDEISTECARQGLPSVQLDSITNFEALLTGTQEPCQVQVSTPTGLVLQIDIFNDGSKYTMVVK